MPSDTDRQLPSRFLNIVTIVCFVGLILGIAGVSSVDHSGDGTYHFDSIVKASIAIFLAVFVVSLVTAAWLWIQLSLSLKAFQRKLLLAMFLFFPFPVVRLAYSAVSDYADKS
ncbi:hypothetical protein BJX63DRAFT_436577 [Aspergillus granulosus]|uniref:DUF7702 domain-containing protein n=1 Tax=Aspergillus granulosus TaxID=176169 RepID=A0ABR4GXL9_9EURO